MAEVTEIISKDAINGIIQTDEALKKTIASLDSLLTKQKEVDTQLNKNKASFEANANAKKKATDNAKQLSLVEQEIAKTQKSLETTQAKLIASTERDVANTKKLAQEKAKLNRETSKTRVEAKALAVLRDKEAGTLEKLAAKNKLLTESRKKLNLSTDEGQRRLKIINNQLDINNAKIKANSDALTKQKINIGNYGSALDKVIPGLSGIIRGIQGATKASLAFIATPLGAILAAIAAVLGPLIAFFTKSQRGMDMMKQAGAALSATIDVLKDRLIAIGEGITNILKGNFSEGITQIKDSFKGLGDEIQRESQLAINLEKDLQTLRDSEIGFITERARLNKEIEKARLLAKDENLTAKERLAQLDIALSKEDERLQKELNFARERARISQEQVNLGESTAEELEKNAQLQAKVIELETESFKRQRTIQSERLRFIREVNKEEEKAAKIKQAEASKLADSQLKTIKSIESAQLDSDKLTISNKLETDRIITEANQKKLDVLTEQEQAAAEQRKLINDASTQLAIDGARAIFEFQSIQSEQDIQRLENKKARELAIAGDDADKRAKIEDKYAKRINAEKVKQAKRDKAAALFDIAIATASNAVKLFAQTIPPGILSGVAIAQGALQAALIASKPIPQFALGTNNAPGTGFIAGERGRELMQLSSGNTMMVDLPTFFKGSKYRGATIKSNPETERIMSSVNDMSIINFDTMSLQKENKRGFRKLERAINNSNFRHNKAISQSYKERYLN